MAYADKSSDMRRFCLAKGGHVQFEGVAFEGHDFILRNRTGWGELPAISNLTEEEIIKFIDEFNSDLNSEDEPLILLYQDKEDSDWDVKTDYVNTHKEEVEKGCGKIVSAYNDKVECGYNLNGIIVFCDECKEEEKK